MVSSTRRRREGRVTVMAQYDPFMCSVLLSTPPAPPTSNRPVAPWLEIALTRRTEDKHPFLTKQNLLIILLSTSNIYLMGFWGFGVEIEMDLR